MIHKVMQTIKTLIEIKNIFFFTLFAINELIFKRFEKDKNFTISIPRRAITKNGYDVIFVCADCNGSAVLIFKDSTNRFKSHL